MSNTTLEEFLTKIKNDKQLSAALNTALREANTSKIVEIARENGYTISEKELSTGYLDVPDKTMFELDDSMLEQMSGGTDRSERIIETINYGDCGESKTDN